MNAVDTNVLFYAHDPRDPAKRATATALLASMRNGALLWQVACEYLSATRKLEPLGYTRAQAWADISDLRLLWTTIVPTWPVLDRAAQLLVSHSLSHWDAVLIAACLDAGIDRLYTEDFSAYPRIETLEIVNPFAPTP
jgi:predicted nucleic acid-binding protein